MALLSERSRRAILGVGVGLGFVLGGLWISGGATRVRALVRTAVSAPRIEPLAGSHASVPQEMTLDGVPARVRHCTAPAGTTLAALREHYDALATRESDCGGGRVLPHVASDPGDVAFVLWTSPRDGHRKGVIAQVEGGVVRYTLVDGEPLPGDALAGGSAPRVYLPGGIVAPEGSRASFSLEESGRGWAFFEAPGSSDAVASALRSSLARAAYHVDERVQPELEAAREAAPRSGGSPVVVSFQGKDRKGFLVVAPARPGTSRVTFALR